MSNLSPVFELALGAVWTAGYRPASDAKSELQRACGWFDHRKMNEHIAASGSGFDGMRDYIRQEALGALEKTGYPLAEEPSGLDLLRPLPTVAPVGDVPEAPDIVRAVNPWMGCSEFALQGMLGARRSGFTIANRNGSWHMGTRFTGGNAVSMGCGGPASIGYLDVSKLRPTDEIDRLQCWDFAFTPAAHTGVHFLVPVRVWEWDGGEASSDFLGQVCEEPA